MLKFSLGWGELFYYFYFIRPKYVFKKFRWIVVEGNVSVLLWSIREVLFFHLDLDQADKKSITFERENQNNLINR